MQNDRPAERNRHELERTPITDLSQAERWLEGLINRERLPSGTHARFGLEAIEALLARIGNPERALSVIHIAGSKGKGSTALLVEALLRAAGERTGVFTSPHLVRWTERFRIDGSEVAEDRLVAAVSMLRPHVEALREPGSEHPPSFFDATTAAALVLFAEAGVDRAVLEVGLGGRLDSTNAVSPAVTCITTIEYEHTDKLGDTLAAIAGEKAGILKPGVPCIVGALPEEAEAVVLARAEELGAPVRLLGEHFGIEAREERAARADATPISFWARGPRAEEQFGFDAELAVPGRHQLANAAVALEAVRALRAHDDTALATDAALATAAARAFATVTLPARLEILSRDPCVIVDSAHTRRSAAALHEFLAALPAWPVCFVLSVSSDKAIDEVLEALIPPEHAARVLGVTVTRAEPIRAAEPEHLAAWLEAHRPEIPVRTAEDPKEAIRSARASLPAGGTLCVTGSIYLAGIARDVLIAS